MDQVFKALADPGRRQLLDQLYHKNGQTLKELCGHLAMSRQAVTKHLSLLCDADLVVPLWRGRQKLHFFNPGPLKQISEAWIHKYQESCLRALNDLEAGLQKVERKR